MKISKRLQAIASYVEENSKVIDVGCDHALLDLYLVENKKNVKVIASDNKEGPLQKAKENIKKYNLEDKIEVMLADGLEKLDTKTDTIVIAGMGYLTIKEILTKGDLSHITNMIVSTNDDFDDTKAFIEKIGFSIQKEEIVEDHNKFYIIIKATKGRKKSIDIKKRNKDYQKYLEYTIIKKREILSKLPRSKIKTRFQIYKQLKKLEKELKSL